MFSTSPTSSEFSVKTVSLMNLMNVITDLVAKDLDFYTTTIYNL